MRLEEQVKSKERKILDREEELLDSELKVLEKIEELARTGIVNSGEK